MVLPILEARAASPFSPENFWPPFSFLYLNALEIWQCINRGISYHQVTLGLFGEAALPLARSDAFHHIACKIGHGHLHNIIRCTNHMQLDLSHLHFYQREIKQEDVARRASGGRHVALTQRNFSMWHIFISQGPRETKYINHTYTPIYLP